MLLLHDRLRICSPPVLQKYKLLSPSSRNLIIHSKLTLGFILLFFYLIVTLRWNMLKHFYFKPSIFFYFSIHYCIIVLSGLAIGFPYQILRSSLCNRKMQFFIFLCSNSPAYLPFAFGSQRSRVIVCI